jgi:hypothetical protein
MLLEKMINSGAIFIPYPVRIDNTNFKGIRFDFSPSCVNECYQGKGRYTCQHGLSFLQRRILGQNIVVGSYVAPGAPLIRDKKSNWSKRVEKPERVLAWLAKFTNLVSCFISEKPEADALGPLHEINRWAAQVHTIAQRMMIKDRDRDFSENFANASRDLRSLYKASTMLIDAFDYLNIYYNPSSADFGKKRSVDLYKMVDKIRIILSEAEAAAQNKKIIIHGELHCNVDVYESFKIIPFCFLQNAIKYSFDNEIVIRFDSNAREIEVVVESVGPEISEEERKRIFEKGYRGEWSKRIHHEGLGVGLYIAKVVAEAHDVEIKVRSQARGYQRDGIPMATNSFGIKMILGVHADRRRHLR